MNDQILSRLLDTVWQQFSRGKADRDHPARHPTLATIGPNGPELRTLVLRAVDRGAGSLEFHTDSASPKATQIAADPRIAVHVWSPKARLQIRVRGTATLLPGDPTLFAQLPPQAQANYTGPVPGTPLTGNAPDTAPRFARLLCHLTEIDTLILADPHQRALFSADTGWQGTWITP